MLLHFLLQNMKIKIASIKCKSPSGWPLKASKGAPLDAGVLHLEKWVSPQATQRIVSELQGVLKMMALLFFTSSSPPGKLIRHRNTLWENSHCPKFWKPNLTSWGWRGTTPCGPPWALLSPSLWKPADQPFRTSMGKNSHVPVALASTL